MKNTAIAGTILLIITTSCSDGKPDTGDSAAAVHQVLTLSVELSDNTDVIQERAWELGEQGNFGFAFDYLDRALEIFGEDPDLLECANDLAYWMEHHDRFLDTALRLEEAAPRKSPWNLLKIAEGLLHTERPEEALVYIERSVDERAFKRFEAFDGKVYDPLRDEPRFQQAIQRAKDSIGIGNTMPELSVRTLDGDAIPLRSLKGKVVLVDFWATWCAPCIRELPTLQDLYATHADAGFEIIGISLDDNPDLARDYVAEREIPWPISHSAEGWQSEMVRHYGVNALPSLWLYDSHGNLRHYNLRGEGLATAVGRLMEEDISDQTT